MGKHLPLYCVRILRRYIDRIGYSNTFTIYDTDDVKSVIKDICKKFNIDTKMLKEKTIMNAISHAKDELMSRIRWSLRQVVTTTQENCQCIQGVSEDIKA